MKALRFIGIVWFSALIVFYFLGGMFPIDSFPKEFMYTKYNRDSSEYSKEYILNEKDAVYIELKKMLSENTLGWSYNFNSVVPNHIFNSSNMKINCLPDWFFIGRVTFFVNYKNEYEKNMTQISKTIKGSCPTIDIK